MNNGRDMIVGFVNLEQAKTFFKETFSTEILLFDKYLYKKLSFITVIQKTTGIINF